MELTIKLPPPDQRTVALGPAERNLKIIRESLGVNIAARDADVTIRGERDAVHAARDVVDRLLSASRREMALSREQVLETIADAARAHTRELEAAPDRAIRDALDVTVGGRRLAPRSANQKHYLNAIFENDMVFGLGPAGTGKTYLAVAAAIHHLRQGLVKKVVLCRPAVEAGEKLGYLPGDFREKVNPYLRPLFDAMHDMLDFDVVRRFMASDVVEIVPLAFMRGRTLNDAAIILDEAQNTTVTQMQMFLTRMGQRSKVVVTGDPTQIDLPEGVQSGLLDAARRLRRIPGIGFCFLTKADVVRHDLVQRVIEAYEPASEPAT
ncbi:MAG: PhoH family protein [Planctomycetota bacterium]